LTTRLVDIRQTGRLIVSLVILFHPAGEITMKYFVAEEITLTY